MEKDGFIGVFDSGIGGLTVVKSLTGLMPEENIIYFGDTEHVPYGSKTEEQIKEYVLNDVRFLSGFELKAVVIACNTADCVAGAEVKRNYDIPVFGIVDAASKKAAETTSNNRIGLMATAATIENGAYVRTVKKYNGNAEVYGVACPLLVPLVEAGRFKKGDAEVENVLKDYLDELNKEKIDTLILGCTHYPLLSDIISELMPEVSIVSSSDCAAQTVFNELENRGLGNVSGGLRRFFVSADADGFQKQASVILGDVFTGTAEQVSI